MANAELLSPLAEATLVGGFMVKLEAIDPTTGAAVTGVTVTRFALYGDTMSGTDDGGGSAPVDQVAPEFVPLPLGEVNP
jgi:hypothetical protein